MLLNLLVLKHITNNSKSIKLEVEHTLIFYDLFYVSNTWISNPNKHHI